MYVAFCVFALIFGAMVFLKYHPKPGTFGNNMADDLLCLGGMGCFTAGGFGLLVQFFN